MNEVKRYKLSPGLRPEAIAFLPDEVVSSRDYDALAARVAELEQAISAVTVTATGEGANAELPHLPDDVFAGEFAAWWDSDGQYVRAGGREYERSFAFEAWRYLYPRIARLAHVVSSPDCTRVPNSVAIPLLCDLLVVADLVQAGRRSKAVADRFVAYSRALTPLVFGASTASPVPTPGSGVTDVMIEKAMNATMPGGSQAWVWLFNCEGGMQPEQKHRDWFRRVLEAACPVLPSAHQASEVAGAGPQVTVRDFRKFGLLHGSEIDDLATLAAATDECDRLRALSADQARAVSIMNAHAERLSDERDRLFAEVGVLRGVLGQCHDYLAPVRTAFLRAESHEEAGHRVGNDLFLRIASVLTPPAEPLPVASVPYAPKGEWSFERLNDQSIVVKNGLDWTIIQARKGPIYEQLLYRYCEAQMLAANKGAPSLTEEQRETVKQAIAEALGDAMDCTRTWSAWSIGTMGSDDFRPVSEDDARLEEITEAAIQAVRACSTTPAAPTAQG